MSIVQKVIKDISLAGKLCAREERIVLRADVLLLEERILHLFLTSQHKQGRPCRVSLGALATARWERSLVYVHVRESALVVKTMYDG